MHRHTLAILLAVLTLTAGACKRRENVRVVQTEEEGPRLATLVHMGDPRSSTQLVSGFYDIEQNSWRWTAGKFSVLLRPPRSAPQKGAVLQLKFSVPEPVLAKLKTVSLRANVQNAALAPETYTQAGEFTYTREVPAQALNAESVRVDFSLDKWLPPSPADQRELGVVVSSVGFEPK